MSVEDHFAALFKPLIEDFGEIDPTSATGLNGFDKGGPVAMCAIPASQVWLSCEVSLYAEQIPSTEGLRFDLFTRNLEQTTALPLLTALANLSFEHELGDLHSVDVAPLELADIQEIQLRLFSKASVGDADFGLYEIVPLR